MPRKFKRFVRLFLKLLKANKRVFGSFFKLKSYEFLAAKTRLNLDKKLKKWRFKHGERKENLAKIKADFNLAKKELKFFLKIAPKSVIWLNSREFKAKYIDTNHPFPPLLNPANIDFQAVPAHIAYELNLPLPRAANFAFVGASFSTHSAMVQGLKKCGVCIMQDHFFESEKQHFIFAYENLLKNAPFVLNLTIYDGLGVEAIKKLVLALPRETPVLFLVRDPVARLLASLNNSWAKPNALWHFDEDTPLANLYARVHYHINARLNLAKRVEESVFKWHTFEYAKMFALLQNAAFTHFEFVDFSQLLPQNAFASYENLAKKFHFTPPKNEAEFSENTWSSYFAGYLPLTFKIGEISLIISAFKGVNRFENVGVKECEVSEILGLKKPFEKDIFIFAKRENLAKITQEKAKITAKMQEFLDTMSEIISLENRLCKVNEAKLLEFFKQNKTLYLKVREIFEKEAEFVSKNAPKILNSWESFGSFGEIN